TAGQHQEPGANVGVDRRPQPAAGHEPAVLGDMAFSPALTRLIDALRVLPGVGNKTAQRMAFYLLQRDTAGGRQLAAAIEYALEHIRHCSQCRMFTERELCAICANERRD